MDNYMCWHVDTEVENPAKASPLNHSSYPPSSSISADDDMNIAATGNKSGGVGDNQQDEKEKSTDESLVGGNQRRKRGRPKGSKNKAKAPNNGNNNNDNDDPSAMRGHVMKIANGADIVKSMTELGTRLRKGVCILNGNGFVKNVTLQIAGEIKAIEGRFQIICLHGSFLPVDQGPQGSTRLTIHLVGTGGHTVAGAVMGPLHASGSVMIMAATFSDIVYHGLGVEQGTTLVACGGKRPVWSATSSSNILPCPITAAGTSGLSGWALASPIMVRRNVPQLQLGNGDAYSSGFSLGMTPLECHLFHQN